MRTPETPFHVRLRDIPSEGLRKSYDLAGDWAGKTLAGTDATVEGHGLTAEVELHRAQLDVMARGKIGGAIVVPCGRCVTPATLLVDAPFAVTFVPAGSTSESDGGDEVEVTDDMADVVTYDEDFVDLEGTLREELLLALPIAHVCDEACKGLCARCGKNLNEGTCECKPEQPEDRWAPLKNLKL